MIVYIEGEILKKDPTLVVIKTASGLGYEVNISINTYNSLSKNHVSLSIIQVIRDDANLLFGFIDEDEKFMFSKLIKVNGIGAKTAQAICSTFTPSGFYEAVTTNNISAIQSVPGIGPKSAKRLLVELNDFVPLEDSSSSTTSNEAFLALESLGFKKEKIKKVLASCKSTITSELIKEALKKF